MARKASKQPQTPPEPVEEPEESTPPEASEEPEASDSDEGEDWQARFIESQAKLKAFERERMSELERAKAEAAEWREKAEQSSSALLDIQTREQFRAAAKDAGIRNPETAYKLVKSQLRLNDKGELVGAAAALKGLQASDPYLFQTAKVGAPGGNSGKPPVNTNGQMNAFLRSKL